MCSHPFSSMTDVGTPFTFALLTEADRQLCGLKTVVSTPALINSFVLLLPTESLDTGLCGFQYVISNSLTLSFARWFRFSR